MTRFRAGAAGDSWSFPSGVVAPAAAPYPDPLFSSWTTSLDPFQQFEDTPAETRSKAKPKGTWNTIRGGELRHHFLWHAQEFGHVARIKHQMAAPFQELDGWLEDLPEFGVSHVISPYVWQIPVS